MGKRKVINKRYLVISIAAMYIHCPSMYPRDLEKIMDMSRSNIKTSTKQYVVPQKIKTPKNYIPNITLERAKKSHIGYKIGIKK